MSAVGRKTPAPPIAICERLREQRAEEASIDYISQGEYFHEASGKKLDGAEVENARREEIAYFKLVGM